MSRVPGVAQVRAQFFYDTDYRCTGTTTGDNVVSSEKILFQSTRNGNLSLSNFPSANGLVGNQLFQIKAVRHEIHFQATNGAVTFTGAFAGVTGLAELLALVLGGSTFDLQVNDRSAFQGPVTMTPAGGGPWGFVSDSVRPLITNGEPTGKQIYALPLPIDIDANEPVKMIEKKYELSASASTSVSVVDAINQFAGQKLGRAYIDGIHTRDAT